MSASDFEKIYLPKHEPGRPMFNIRLTVNFNAAYLSKRGAIALDLSDGDGVALLSDKSGNLGLMKDDDGALYARSSIRGKVSRTHMRIRGGGLLPAIRKVLGTDSTYFHVDGMYVEGDKMIVFNKDSVVDGKGEKGVRRAA